MTLEQMKERANELEILIDSNIQKMKGSSPSDFRKLVLENYPYHAELSSLLEKIHVR